MTTIVYDKRQPRKCNLHPPGEYRGASTKCGYCGEPRADRTVGRAVTHNDKRAHMERAADLLRAAGLHATVVGAELAARPDATTTHTTQRHGKNATLEALAEREYSAAFLTREDVEPDTRPRYSRDPAVFATTLRVGDVVATPRGRYVIAAIHGCRGSNIMLQTPHGHLHDVATEHVLELVLHDRATIVRREQREASKP